MLESWGRGQYQRLFANQVAHFLWHTLHCHPNVVTLMGVICGIFSAILYSVGWLGLAVFMLIVSGIFDTLDGTVARLSGQSSSIGTVFDILSDRFVEGVIIFALYWAHPQTHATGAVLMLIASYLCVSSFFVVGFFSENTGMKSFHYSPGLIERAEAFIFFIAIMLLPNYFNLLSGAYFILTLYTAVARVWAWVNCMRTS